MNYDEIKDKRIAVLLSGGVDSSVVVYEFARSGLTPRLLLYPHRSRRERRMGLQFGRRRGDGNGWWHGVMAADSV